MDSHEQATFSARKVMQTFFFIFIIIVVAIFAKEILRHTDGNVVTASSDSEACKNIEAQKALNDAGIKAVKCVKQD